MRLEEQRSTRLDGSGNGTVTLGPVPSAYLWLVRMISVEVVPDSPMPSARVYKATANLTGTLLGATFLGGGESSELAQPVELTPNEVIRVEWAGGDPGATATAYLLGQQRLVRG